jgi:Uma2 family endonuclease
MAGLTTTVPAEQRFLIGGLDYKRYVAISDAIGEQPIRVTYDRGRLELMVVSREHERYRYLLALLVSVVAEEMDIDIDGGGMMTFRREELDRGFEHDECWWIQHEAQMRGRIDYDPENDPPPDLGLEIEITRGILNRLSIMGALGVPEIWRFDGEALRVLLLGSDGKYHESAKSQAFPFLPVAELARFVALRSSLSDTAIVRAFREWVREQKAKGWSAADASSQNAGGSDGKKE